MASQVFTEFLRGNAAGEIDLNDDDVRVKLVMSNTTVDTEDDGITTLSGFTTIDECDGANYVDKALANEAVNKDDANNRAEFDADDATWTSLGVGTRQSVGFLVYKYVDGAGNDIPIGYVEFASPVTHNGGDFTIQWNAEGILQLAK